MGVGTNYTGADGSAQTFAVGRATPTSIAISNLPSSGVFGGSFTATVGTNGDGTISITSSSTGVCTVSGLAVTYVGIGSCSLSAHVGSGTDYNASDGNAQSFAVAKGTTTTVLSAGSPVIAATQALTLTATVSVASGSGSLGGTVSFFDGTTAITGCSNVAVSSGKATCSATLSAAGSHSITASYADDPHFGASSSSAATVTVSGSAIPAAPTGVTAAQGKSNQQVIVSWSAVPVTGGTVTYTVKDGNGNLFGPTASTSLVANYTSSQVANTLTFTVTASDSAGSGNASESSAPLTIVNVNAVVGTPETVVSTGNKPVSTAPVAVPAAAGGTAATVTATVQGGAVTVEAYSNNPVTGVAFAVQGSAETASTFFDLKASATTKLVTFQICAVGLTTSSLVYEKGGKWLPVAATQYSPLATKADGTTCSTISVKKGDKAPSLSDLQGTVFAVVRIKASAGALLTTTDGTVFEDGKAKTRGNLNGVVGVASTPDGKGYWVATSDGSVFAFGDAKLHGSIGSSQASPGSPVSAIVGTPDGNGYYLVTQAGGVYGYGDAKLYGSLVQQRVRPFGAVVAATLTSDGKGYWLATIDGQVYAFGDAKFHGSFVSSRQVLPYRIVGIAATPGDKGYYLVTAVGQVHPFGPVKSIGQLKLTSPLRTVVGIVPSGTGRGYSLIGSNGSVYGFGDAKSFTPPKRLASAIVGAAAV